MEILTFWKGSTGPWEMSLGSCWLEKLWLRKNKQTKTSEPFVTIVPNSKWQEKIAERWLREGCWEWLRKEECWPSWQGKGYILSPNTQIFNKPDLNPKANLTLTLTLLFRLTPNTGPSIAVGPHNEQLNMVSNTHYDGLEEVLPGLSNIKKCYMTSFIFSSTHF